ncbi:MAG: hypothetical protein QOJ85_4937 [Solirubrobacteraceae bacterium]|nr:hypothetical protein [Solirubrobacteraceae bacterium]
MNAFGEGGDRQLVAMWCDGLLEIAEGPERSDGWTLLRDREGLLAVSRAMSMSPPAVVAWGSGCAQHRAEPAQLARRGHAARLLGDDQGLRALGLGAV